MASWCWLTPRACSECGVECVYKYVHVTQCTCICVFVCVCVRVCACVCSMCVCVYVRTVYTYTVHVLMWAYSWKQKRCWLSRYSLQTTTYVDALMKLLSVSVTSVTHPSSPAVYRRKPVTESSSLWHILSELVNLWNSLEMGYLSYVYDITVTNQTQNTMLPYSIIIWFMLETPNEMQPYGTY